MKTTTITIDQAVELSRKCAEECKSCAKEYEDTPEMEAFVSICTECASECDKIVAMDRNSSTFKQALEKCADACDRCVVECEKYDTESCNRCADTCTKCANELRAVEA